MYFMFVAFGSVGLSTVPEKIDRDVDENVKIKEGLVVSMKTRGHSDCVTFLQTCMLLDICVFPSSTHGSYLGPIACPKIFLDANIGQLESG